MIIDVLNQYKEINLQIINALKNDKEDVELLEKRGEILNKMFSMDVEKNQLRRLYDDMGLKDLDMELERTIKEKMDSVKEEIRTLSRSKEANKTYSSMNRQINFFSKKI